MWKEFRNILLFILLSLASGWMGVWIDKSIEPQPEGNSLGMGIWLLLPFLISVFLRFFETNAWNDLKPNISGIFHTIFFFYQNRKCKQSFPLIVSHLQ